MNEEKKNYEICFLLKSEPEKEDILAAIGRYHLEIIDDGQLSRIRLAYPISKEKFAYFGYLRFKSDPQDIVELDKILRSNPRVLRHLVISLGDITPAVVNVTPVPLDKKFTRLIPDSDSISPKSPKVEILSNKELEKKLEEILQ